MYHCDGAIYPLIPELIELGVDLLNPIQPDAKGMEAQRLKGLPRPYLASFPVHRSVDPLRLQSQEALLAAGPLLLSLMHRLQHRNKLRLAAGVTRV